MQDEQLTLLRVLERATTLHSHGAIVTRTGSTTHRESYAELGERVARLAGALAALGVRPGDRVGTFAWNSWRHLELYFAVPCLGAILHTLNIRLHPEQTAWIANHAEDRLIVIDDSLVETFDRVVPSLASAERLIVAGDGGDADWITDRYEGLLAEAEPRCFPELQENEACMLCYTSGTSGDPKGVLYSHRSTVLHSLMLNQASVYGLTDRDVVLPLAPMFHANAWGLPYAAAAAGASLVFTGDSSADPAVVADLIETEQVTLAAAIPTVWTSFLEYLDDHPADLSALRMVTSGGAAVPASLIEAFDRDHRVSVFQGWGMTETGPLGTLSRLPRDLDGIAGDARYAQLAKQGRPVPGMRLRVVDQATGGEVPWDGRTVGELEARGPWVAAGYYRDPSRESFHDGWLQTGDVAVVDEFGTVQIVDRTKDLIRSGGEWISSLALEAALIRHPAVREAAVVAIPNERWGERPVAWVTLAPGTHATPDELREHLGAGFPKWWLPDEIRVVREIPKTSVGKLDKRAIRELSLEDPAR